MALRNVKDNLNKKKRELEEQKKKQTASKPVTTAAKKSTPAKNVAKKAAQSASKKTTQKVTYYSKSKGASGAARNVAQKTAQTVKSSKNAPTPYQRQKIAQTNIKGRQLNNPIMTKDYFKGVQKRGVNSSSLIDQIGAAAYAAQDPSNRYFSMKARTVTMNPLEAMQADAMAGRGAWLSDLHAKKKELSDKEKAMQIVKSAKTRLRNREVAKQPVSDFDRRYMNDAQIRQKQEASLRYKEAQRKGDKAGMEKAHRDAEILRGLHGYSGGVAGDQYISPDVPQDVYNRLNDQGVLAWKQAQMQRQRAVTEDEIAKADARINEVLRAKGFQKGPQTDADTSRGWSFGPEGRRMWAGTREQNLEDARQGKAALKATGEGIVGGLAYAGQIVNRASRDRYEAENIDKWIVAADNYDIAKNNLETYDSFVKEFGHPPDWLPNRNMLVMQLNEAIQARAQLQKIRGDVDSLYFDPAEAQYYGLPTTREETFGERMLRQAAEHQAEATEGMSGAEKFVTDALISTGQSLPGMALGAIPGVGPALGLGVLGAQAGGSRAYELKQQGLTASEAALGGLVSGGIEILTEKLPLESFAKIVRGKTGRAAISNILRQAGLEGTEEAISYVGNYIADQAMQHPDAQFSWAELLENAGMGAISGAAFGTVGSMIAEGRTNQQVKNYQMDEANRVKETASQIKSWHEMVDMGAVSREEGQAVLSQLSAEIGSNRILTKEEADLWSGVAELQTQYLQGEISRKEKVQAQDQAVKEIERTSGEQTATLWDDAWKSANETDTKQPGYAMKMYRQAQQTLAKAAEAEKQAEQKQAEQNEQTPVETVEDRKVQADLPPLQWERSRFPMTSMLGAAIDSYRENQAKKAREEQMREWEAQRSPQVDTETQRAVLARNISTFGENGQKAIMTAYHGEDVSSYRKAFAQVYDQAVNGKTQEQIRQPKALTDPQFYAAVQSGLKDRTASAMQTSRATGRNRNAGVDMNDSYVQSMDRSTVRMIDGVAKALGVQVQFVDSVRGGTANAEITGNVVQVEKNNPNPVRAIIGHELTHRMQSVAPDAYRSFRDYVMTNAASQQAVDRKIAEYKAHGVELTREEAMDEITADYAGELYENSDQMQEFIRRNYENRTLLERVRDFFKELAAKLTGKEKAQADEAVRLLEEVLRSSSEAVEKMGTDRKGLAGQNEEVDPPTRFSISSLGDALGFDVRDYVDGHVEFYRDGKQVKKVTTADVRKSRMGQMIVLANQNGFITDKDVNKQMRYLARLANMILDTNDAQMVYAFAGSMSWSAVKDNADKQYGMTIDFEAICKKTEAMVAAMSEAMMRKGRGLTLEEIDILYSKVVQAGETVPCPPCYVFSRWIGLGGLLDNIKSFQTEFPDTADGTAKARRRLQEIRDILADDIEELKAQDEERVRKNKEAAANGVKKTKRDLTPKSLDDLTNAAKKKRLEQLNNEENKLITRRNKALSKLQFDDLTEAERAKVQDDLKKVDTAYAEFTRQNRIMRMYSWLKDVRLSESYKEVPDSILFDLRAGEKFAGMYEDTWAFRTGQGAYYGKAITPYTDARLGEIIQGVHKKAAEIKIGDANPFSGTFDAMDLTSKQKTELNAAYTAVKRQNLRGGVRMQSVSDFRYEYGLDYIQSFFELQAIGAAIQTYTKVVEFVDMASSTGAFVNMSLIPWGMGFKDGKLAYSSVTGMDAEAAFELQKQWDTAGTILIGVSDEHIRAAMADDNIYFIIPYHKSGGRDDVIRGMLKALDERIEKYEDYTNVQGEEFPANANPELTLRNKILTASGFFELNSKERALVEENEFLRSLYNRKFYQQGDPLYGVKMTSEDCKHIYPYEYWDPTSTYKTADINGKRYLEWCEALDVVPKFSGNAKGEHDFRHDKGYWKLLIDRRMYDRKGRYIPLTPINVSGLDLKQLDQERARERFGKAMTAPADLKKTQGIVDAAFPETAELSDANTRYSIRTDPPPKKTGVAYKVFYAKDGQLYPPMVANPGGEGTPVGVWLDADVGVSAPPSKTGRAQVKAGGKGTQGTSGSLAFRPGWHLGDIPQATQFARMNPATGKKELFPANFVWAECEYAADVDYQDEAMSYGYTENGKFRHSYAGLPKVPTDGYYRYRTNPKPDTVPWIITGAMKVKRILTDEETDAICRENGVEPMARQGGPLTAESMERDMGIRAGDTEGRYSIKSDNLDNVVSVPQNGSRGEAAMSEAMEDERRIFALRDEIQKLQDDLDAWELFPSTRTGWAKETEDKRNRKARNRIVKLQSELDKLIAKERSLSRKTSIADILDNLDRYRRSDLESLAEQLSDGAWDDYEELSDTELRDGIRAAMEERMEEMSPLDVQAPKYGFYVRPVEKSYSLKGSGADQARLMRENQQLREKVDYWKSQTKRSDRTKVDPKEVTKLAKRLANDYTTAMDAAEIAGQLQAIYNGLGKEWTYDQAYEAARKLAGEMIQQASETDDYLYNEYDPMRKFFRETPLVISPELQRGIADYNDWRKAQMGKLRIQHGDVSNVDQVYQELSQMWPEWFDETKESHSLDQLERISEVLDEVYAREEQNPFGDDMETPASYLAAEIMGSFWDMPNVKKTYADRAEARLGREVSRRLDMQEKYQESLQKVREKRDEKLQAQKEKYLGKEKARSQRQKERERRAQIMRHMRDLKARFERGTDKKNVPETLYEPVRVLLESINLSSKDEKPTKRTEEFKKVRKLFQEAKKTGELVIDENLFGSSEEGIQGNFDAVISMYDVPIANMNLDQLNTVWQTIRAVEHAISTYGKTLASKKYERTQDWTDALAKEAETRRPMRSLGSQRLLLDYFTPYTFFSQYGSSGIDIFHMLRAAQDVQQRRVDEIVAATEKIVTSKKVKDWKRQRFTFDADGTTLTLTADQIMDLYLLSKRPQAKNHLLAGGIVQPEVKGGGKTIRRGTDAIHITPELLGEIVSKLSDEQVEVANKLQKLTINVLAQWGNEASMRAYGYEKFTEPNYWTIRTAAEGIHSSVENNRNNPRSTKNMGLAMSTVPNASNALDLMGAFENFGRHAMEMITYSTWLNPMEDANRIFNWQFKDENGYKTGATMKGLLDEVGGHGSQDYWSQLMKDIQNGISNGYDAGTARIINKLIANSKAAAVGANLRVVIQQPTAILRANAVMNPADLTAGLAGAPTKGSGWKKAVKWSGIAARKKMGGFDIAAPGRSEQTLFGQRTLLETVADVSGWAAGKADAITWGKIWNACEWQVKRQNKGLRLGSDEYYQKVAEVFSDVINQTQVVDGVLQRSQIMRSSHEILKQATSFMGEPIMSMNMLMRSWNNWRYQNDPKKRTAARKALGKAAAAYVTTCVVNALAQAVVDGLRDDDKDRTYLESLMAAFIGTDFENAKMLAQALVDGIKSDEADTTLAQRIAKAYYEQAGEDADMKGTLKEIFLNGNVMENLNPMQNIPFLSDIMSIEQGYDVTRMDADIIADVLKKFKYFTESWSGEGKQTKWYATVQLAAQIGKMFGIPGHTVIRDVTGGLRLIAKKSGNVPFMYEIEKAIYSNTSDKNKSMFQDLAWQALKDGDVNTFNHIREDLMNGGIIDGKAMDSAMRKKVKAEQEKDPEFTLGQDIMDLLGIYTKYTAEQEEEEEKFTSANLDAAQYEAYALDRGKTYRAAENEVLQMDAFDQMSDEDKDATLKVLHNYAEKTALEAHSNGQYVADDSTISSIREAEEQGISPAAYVVLKTLVSSTEGIKDADGNTITNSTSIAKMEAMDSSGIELTKEQREYMAGKLQISSKVLNYNADTLGREKAAIQEKADAPSTLSVLGEGNEGIVEQFYSFADNAHADYDGNGKAIKGRGKQDKIIQYIKEIPGLTNAQRSALYHTQYTSDKNNPWA